MNKVIILFFSLFFFSSSFCQDGKDRLHVFDNRTTPDDPNVLFYIHKNTNPNAVVYALNLGADKKINKEDKKNPFLIA